MKRYLLLLSLVLLPSTPALALDPFRPGEAYSYNGAIIPSQQTLSPAGHEDIAFRPACSQVNEVLQANGFTAYTVNLPDSTVRILNEMTPAPRSAAEFELDAAGLCKIGGEVVPIVFFSQLPEASVVQPEVSGTPGESIDPQQSSEVGVNWWMVLSGFVVLAAAGCGLVGIFFKAQSSKPQNTSEVADTLRNFAKLAQQGDK